MSTDDCVTEMKEWNDDKNDSEENEELERMSQDFFQAAELQAILEAEVREFVLRRSTTIPTREFQAILEGGRTVHGFPGRVDGRIVEDGDSAQAG